MVIELGEVVSDCVELLDKLKSMPSSRELSLAITKIQEARHWIIERETVERGD